MRAVRCRAQVRATPAEASDVATSHVLKLRYAATCTECGADLAPGTTAFWDASRKLVRCMACIEADSEVSNAGASAQGEYERRVAKRDAAVRDRFPRIGGVLLTLFDEPQT